MISVYDLVRFLKIRHFRFRFGSLFDFFGSVNLLLIRNLPVVPSVFD